MQEFSLIQRVKSRSGAHSLLSYGNRGLSPEQVKWPGREAHYSSVSSAEVKNDVAIPPLPHTPTWHSVYNQSHGQLYLYCNDNLNAVILHRIFYITFL